jgi:hypothetical protein
LISFDIELTGGQTVAQFMDMMSNPATNATPLNPSGRNLMVTFKAVNPGEEGYEDFLKNKDYYGDVWELDANGNYKVAAWRTKKLSQSFAYIIAVFAGSAAEESTTPVIKIDYSVTP